MCDLKTCHDSGVEWVSEVAMKSDDSRVVLRSLNLASNLLVSQQNKPLRFVPTPLILST